MKKEAVDQARQELDVQHLHQQPEVEQLRDELAALAALVENQRAELVESRANVQLVRDFMGLLPSAETETKLGIRSNFITNNPAEKRAIQSSVVWLRVWSGAVDFGGAGCYGVGYPNVDFMVRPYWIVGQSYKSQGRKQFLLAPASTKPVHRGDVDRGNYVDFGSWSPTHRLIKRAADQLLILEPKKSDGDRLSSLESKFFDQPTEAARLYPSKIDHKTEGAETVSMYARQALHKIHTVEGVTDHDIEAYGVLQRMYRLATLFDKKEGLDSLLTEYPRSLDPGTDTER